MYDPATRTDFRVLAKFVRTPSTTEPRVTQNDVKYDLARPEDKQEEEETVGLVSSPPPPSSTTGQNPFDDSHAVSTKPFWHRAIVAGVILAALIGVGLALGLGVKKIAGKVADIEAERAQSSLASIRSLHSPTSLSSTSSSPATPSPAATSSVLTLVATTPPSTTSPSSTPGSGSIRLDDISWAVPKTVR
ncbi:uncharacterized protein JCM6883_000091 [Sporobolomyces salmoneus]|uniref:uncharacterized protein n=1 Tax=Sporobolomyces salmoneus TaxID=183962 RepID=UPI003181F2DC